VHLRPRARTGHPPPVSAVVPGAGVEAADGPAEAGNRPSLRLSPLERSKELFLQGQKKRLPIVGN